MDPSTDLYYYWLCVISIPVFYNMMLLVARSELAPLQNVPGSEVFPGLPAHLSASSQVLF